MMSIRFRALLVAAGGSVVLAGVIYASQPVGWTRVDGYRTDSSGRVDFSLTYRPPEADYVELVEGRVSHFASCRSGTFTDAFFDDEHTIERSGIPSAECFELATNPVLGAVRMAQGGDWASATERSVDGRVGKVVTGIPGWAEVVIDTELDLPLSATNLSGDLIEWHYTAVALAVAPGPMPPAGGPDETYVTLSPAAAAKALGVAAIPMTIGTVPFDTALSYFGGQMTSVRTYVVWSDAKGRQVQVSIGQDPSDGEGLIVEEMGDSRELNATEGPRTLKIFATDAALFREVVTSIRPAYLSSIP
jgi:hypothetical protein